MKLREITNVFFRGDFNHVSQKEDTYARRALDRLCLQNALSRFLMSGSKDDAFDVYFCFCEIYDVLGEGYQGNIKKLLNILGDHETKAGALKDNYRDHYSHSVYVFSLGIAVYQLNESFRRNFSKHCLCGDCMSVNEEFMYRWGLTALFHDIGYPFEIAFNNIKDYTMNVFGKTEPLLTYKKISKFSALSSKKQEIISKVLGLKTKYSTVHTLLAQKVSQIMGIDNDIVLNELNSVMKKATEYMDHAYFSAIIMLKKFIESKTITKASVQIYIDACASILLHASFWRRKLGVGKKISIEQPLAFLLMLCDELQIFDRIGYGRKSKSEPLPRNCYLEESDGALNITYAFCDGAIDYYDERSKYSKGGYIEYKRNGIEQAIKDLFDLAGFGKIKIFAEISKSHSSSVYHLSMSFFQNILDIAMQVHNNYLNSPTYNKLEKEWDKLSLEIKMSNILQAKSYAEKLNKLGYFYDDRDLMLEKVNKLTEQHIEELVGLEHIRWCDEKKQMGWEYAAYDASNDELRKAMRAQRKHNCLVDYDLLSSNDQEKDKETIRLMIENLHKANFSVYKANKIKTEEKINQIGITGHCDLSKMDINKIKVQIGEKLRQLSSNPNYQTIILCACAQGFDLLAAEAAMELDLRIKVIIPFEDAQYISGVEKYDGERIFAKVMNYKNKEILRIPPLVDRSGLRVEDGRYIDLSRYIVGNSNILIAGWDRKETDKLGGTYYTVSQARKYGKHIEVVDLSR